MNQDNYLELLQNFTNEELLHYLQEKKIIFDTMNCLYCRLNMKLSKMKKSELGFNWRCVNKQCEHYETTLSLYHNSFHHNSSISVRKHLKIIYFLLKKVNQANISDFTGVGIKTIGIIKQKLITLIENYFVENPIRLGGISKTVQVDETKLNKCKIT